ncbi:MAG TPA: winged helix-turn-helix domain-containing protein [Vicinamibacteria bacterium]|nr:winged helix-turn-helix domain-containing protein [Vicinamibacteria bacterium]
MSQVATPRRILRFGSFEVDLASGELRRQGLRISLQDQPFRLLALLLERAGEVVTREELRDRLWPADTFVDFDHSLNTAVRKLREALGDSAESPRYVETLARRGYRFVAPLAEPGPTAPLAHSADADAASLPPSTAARLRSSARRALVIAAVLSSAALLAYWLGPRAGPRTPPGRRLTLAVLPFDNLSGDADQEYLSDGLTEEMITQLGRLEPDRLRVTARSSTWKYKHADRDIDRLRRDLGADYVLEGSLRRAGERVRVTAQLIQAADQTHVWAETYERDLGDVLVLESEVARAVARAIALTLTPDAQARLASARSVGAESYQDYLRGRYFWNRRTEAALKQALGYFQRAIAADPDDARAYSGLADCYSALGASSVVGGLPPRQAVPEAKAAALKALQIDGTLAEAHNSLAMVHLLYDWDLAASEREFRRALELDPDYTTADHWYSHTLTVLGRTDESLAESKRALELEPLNLAVGSHLGWHYLYARQYDQAIEQFRKTLELDPAFPPAQRYAAWAYLQKGMRQEAIASLRAALGLLGRNPEVEGELGHALGVAGRRAEALAMLEGLRQLSSTRGVSPYSIALVHGGLGDRDQALAWLEKAYVERSDYMPYLSREPMLDGLRSDPRFAALVRRIGLPN